MKRWTQAEDTIVGREYPNGWRAVQALLPHRSHKAIVHRACFLDVAHKLSEDDKRLVIELTGELTQVALAEKFECHVDTIRSVQREAFVTIPKVPTKTLHWSEWQDALVRKIYVTQSFSERRRLLKQHLPTMERNKAQAYARAIALGVIQPLKKPLNWSDAEIDILEEFAHKTDRYIAARLKAAGFDRTAGAVHVYRIRHVVGFRQGKIDAGIYTANQVGEIVGAASKTVTYWIRQGWLKAKRGPMHGPNEVWEVTAKDLRSFVIRHIGYCDLSRADKYALIDLLCPEHGPKQIAA